MWDNSRAASVGFIEKNLPYMQEPQVTQVQFLGWEDPLVGGRGQPTPVFLPGESHGQRSLAGCSPWGRKEFYTTEATLECTHTGGIILTENQLQTGGGIPV